MGGLVSGMVGSWIRLHEQNFYAAPTVSWIKIKTCLTVEDIESRSWLDLKDILNVF